MDEKKLRDYEPFWNNWYIDSLIGEGSFGSVYKITREEFGEKYASALKIISMPKSQSEIKRVLFEGLNEEEAKEYFRGMVEDIYKEIKMMTKLKGKTYIVSYEDHQVIEKKGEIGYLIFIRMELLKGLNEYKLYHAMSNQEVVQMGKDLCQALMLCQKHKIMHRDIKPDNIFVSEDGDFKLGDFGIARQAEQTNLGLSIKGSYEYMAPEVYLGKDYDSRVDIYSLGLVLYTFLNENKTPLIPTDIQSVTYKHRQEALRERFGGKFIPRPSMASTELGDVVLKAIAYNPSDRYNTAEEFFEALESVRSLEPSRNQELDYFSYSAPKIQRVNAPSKPEENLLSSNSLPKEETVLSWAKAPFIKRILVHSKLIGIMVALVVTIAIASGIFMKIKSDNQTEPADIEASQIPTQGEETQETLELNLSKKNLKDISSIKDLKRISLLNLDDNQITDISLLEQSLQLEYLSLRNNQVENMDSLAGLEELTYFDGSGNQIRDITAIKDKDKLSVLVLSNNKIQDLSLIKDLENLTMLHLDNNQITQVNGLENLENLVFLNLSNNEIENYTPLYGLEKLEYLILRDTEISEKQLEELKEALPNCEIDHTTKVEEH